MATFEKSFYTIFPQFVDENIKTLYRPLTLHQLQFSKPQLTLEDMIDYVLKIIYGDLLCRFTPEQIDEITREVMLFVVSGKQH
jgi:hypothetical protein